MISNEPNSIVDSLTETVAPAKPGKIINKKEGGGKTENNDDYLDEFFHSGKL